MAIDAKLLIPNLMSSASVAGDSVGLSGPFVLQAVHTVHVKVDLMAEHAARDFISQFAEQSLQLHTAKLLDRLAGRADEMVVMPGVVDGVPRRAVRKNGLAEHARIGKQLEGPVDRGAPDVRELLVHRLGTE